MKVSELLFCLALPLVMSAPRDDPLVADFRRYLEAICTEANGNWSQPYRVPDADEALAQDGDGWVSLDLGYLDDLHNVSRDGDCTVGQVGDTVTATANVLFKQVQFTYDFSIDSGTIPDASGCVYGTLSDVRGSLVVEAGVENTSSVVANVRSLQLRGPGMLELDYASETNLYGRFSDDVSVAMANLLNKKIFPFLEIQIGNIMNATLTSTTFNLSAFQSVPSTLEQSDGTLPTSLNSSSGTNFMKPSGSKITIAETPLARKLVTAANQNDVNQKQSPSKGTIHFTFAPRKDKHSGGQSPNERDVSCAFTRTAENFKNGTAEERTVYKMTLPRNHTNVHTLDVRRRTLSSDEYPALKDSMNAGFNNLFDTLLDKTGREILNRNLEPYRIPDAEEELYQASDGSVELGEGDVYGMDTMALSSDPIVNVHGAIAKVSAAVIFTNITYSFKFSASTKASSSVSGTVHGNISNPSGEMSIVANLTDPAAVTVALKSFKLQATVEDFSTDVGYTGNATGKLAEEVSEAVLADFEDSIVQRLQDVATAVLRRAVAGVRVEVGASSTTTNRPGSSSKTTWTATTTSHTGSTKPSSSPSFSATGPRYLILVATLARAIAGAVLWDGASTLLL